MTMQTLWPTARDKFAEGLIDWDGDSFLLIALDSTYTYDAAHEFRDDLTGVLGTASLVNTSIASGGACDADDTSLSARTPGSPPPTTSSTSPPHRPTAPTSSGSATA